MVSLRRDEEMLPNIVQIFVKTNVTQKYDVTFRIVKTALEFGRIIIFCNVSELQLVTTPADKWTI